LRLANCKQAKEVEPYLARFEDDWVTGQILRQYINGRRKYDTAKANGMGNSGDKRQRMSASVTDQRINRHRRSVGSEGGGDNSSDNEMDGSNGFDKTNSDYDNDDEWTGIHDAWSDDEDVMEVNGNENSG
jgi:hypothetical protein